MTPDSVATTSAVGAKGTPVDGRYVVISVDGHVGPFMRDDLRQYCPPQHLDEYDDFVREAESQVEVVPGGPSFLGKVYLERRDIHGNAPGLRDPHQRLRDLD